MTKDKHPKKHQADQDNLVQELMQQAAERLAGWQRAQADYQNLRKEMEEKLISSRRHVKGDILTQFLPIYQNLLVAFDHIPETERGKDWAIGFQHIKKQLESFFEDLGLEHMRTVGEQFDHNLHEAVESVADDKHQDQEIIKEINPGYTLDGDILLHPKVVVNSLPREDS